MQRAAEHHPVHVPLGVGPKQGRADDRPPRWRRTGRTTEARCIGQFSIVPGSCRRIQSTNSMTALRRVMSNASIERKSAVSGSGDRPGPTAASSPSARSFAELLAPEAAAAMSDRGRRAQGAAHGTLDRDRRDVGQEDPNESLSEERAIFALVDLSLCPGPQALIASTWDGRRLAAASACLAASGATSPPHRCARPRRGRRHNRRYSCSRGAGCPRVPAPSCRRPSLTTPVVRQRS